MQSSEIDGAAVVVVEGRRMLTTNQVAHLAGCGASNIRNLLRHARIPAPRTMNGQTWLYDEEEIMAWLPGRPRRGGYRR